MREETTEAETVFPNNWRQRRGYLLLLQHGSSHRVGPQCRYMKICLLAKGSRKNSSANRELGVGAREVGGREDSSASRRLQVTTGTPSSWYCEKARVRLMQPYSTLVCPQTHH